MARAAKRHDGRPESLRVLQDADGGRPNAYRRGYGRRWSAYRWHYLSQHRLCRRCELVGRTRAATEVDHVVPHRGNKKLFWDPTNHQPLCKSCHSTKTATEDGGFGHRRHDGIS